MHARSNRESIAKSCAHSHPESRAHRDTDAGAYRHSDTRADGDPGSDTQSVTRTGSFYGLPDGQGPLGGLY